MHIKISKQFLSGVLLLLFLAPLKKGMSQDDPKTKYFSVYHKNTIEREGNLDRLFDLLYNTENKKTKRPVRIVWIGDSHTQADMMTSVIRQSLQDKFGHAGRGLIFPYQVAKTSSPKDLMSKSNVAWIGQRNSRPDQNPICGISGHGMHCNEAYTNIELCNMEAIDSFNFIRLFVDTTPITYGVDYLSFRHEKKYVPGNDSTGIFFRLLDYTNTLNIYTNNPEKNKTSIYGMSLESINKPGVIFHTIGVNGAQYKSYLQTKNFWKQIQSLEADAYIIYLGTNEAQNQKLDNNELYEQIDSMINQLQKLTPNACFLLCTPPVSYYQKTQPNYTLIQVSKEIERASIFNCTAYWDLFSISKGISGTFLWKKFNLLNNDLVHFTKEGYALQGSLFTDAFLSAYELYKQNKNKRLNFNTIPEKNTEDRIKMKSR